MPPADQCTLTRASCLRAGPIYCSPITARVLRHDFGLRPDCLRVLELDETVTIAGVSCPLWGGCRP